MAMWGKTLLCILACFCWSTQSVAYSSDAPRIGARVIPETGSSQYKRLKKLEVALCKKLAQCRPSDMRASDCRKASKQSDDFLHTAPRGVFSASQQKLKTCTRGIKRASCAEFFSEVPPEGCEFFR